MTSRLFAALALLIATVSIFAPAEAAAQPVEPCAVASNFSERWRTRTRQGVDNWIEYRNTCAEPVHLFVCISRDPNPESCSSITQFQSSVLQPGGRYRAESADGSRAYMHAQECRANADLIDWKSQFTEARGLRCKSRTSPNRSAYPGIGTVADPASPVARQMRSTGLFDISAYPLPEDSLAEGRTVARIAVSPEGRATGCHIVSSSGYFDLDRVTCETYMKRGRFSPAKDASGTPVAGMFQATVTWAAP